MLAELTALGIIFFAFFAGFVVGKTHNGVSININHETKVPQHIPDEYRTYNKSTADMLPDEIKGFLDKTNGYIK